MWPKTITFGPRMEKSIWFSIPLFLRENQRLVFGRVSMSLVEDDRKASVKGFYWA